jgi:hypothetical protein
MSGTLWLSEYAGGEAYAAGKKISGIPQAPALNTQAIACTVSASTATLGANTRLIGLQADTGVCVSLSSVAATSTNSPRIPGNVAPVYFGVTPGQKLTAVSTV